MIDHAHDMIHVIRRQQQVIGEMIYVIDDIMGPIDDMVHVVHGHEYLHL